MEKGILLNDAGLKVNVIFENDNIVFEFDKNYEFLSNLLRVEKTETLTFVYLGLKKILRIENNNIERILPVSQTDIKVLKALYENNNDLNSRNILDYFSNIRDEITSYTYSNKTTTRAFGIIPKVKTITHTYLTEILDAPSLIRFLNEYDIKYPLNDYGALDFNSNKYYSYDEVEFNGWANNLERCLKINLAHNSSIERYNDAVKNREQLLKLACESLEEMLGDSAEWKKIETDIKEASDDIVGQLKSLDEIIQDKSKQEKKKFNKEKIRLNEKLNKLNKLKSSQSAKILYNELLNISLDKLTNDKVDYSTIGLTNDTRLEFMSMKHKGDKRFNFLYSIDQNKTIKKFEDYAKSLESLLNNRMVIGAEITGFEETYDNLKEKLEWILPVLHIHPRSVIRIHANSFADHTDQIYEVLHTIKEVSIRLNEACADLFASEWGILPPPVVRIAHGLRLEDKPELVKLIKEFDAVIEYSLSANKALRNIKDYSKISLGFYDKNKIKYVFSNDGGGMFYYKENEFNDDLFNSKQEIINFLNEDKPQVTETPKVEVKEEEIKEEVPVTIEPEEQEVVIKPIKEEIEAVVENDEPLEEEDVLEQTLYDIFAELKKDTTVTKFDNYESALNEENKIFTYENKVLSESEKVNDELLRIRNYIALHNLDIDNDYLESKIAIINSYNENSDKSDYAKMYLFLLERELFPDLSTSFKSVEYLYQNQNKEKTGIEETLDKTLNLVIKEYDKES